MTEQTATAALSGDNGGAGAGAAQPGAAGAPAAGGSAPWYGQADEATAAYITNKGWDNPIKAIESYRNLEKFAGGSKSLIELPGDDAPPEKVSEFYDRLGRPKSPAEYGLQVPEGADKGLADWFTKTAHDQGLNAKQAKGLFEQWQAMSSERVQAMEAEAAQATEIGIRDLKREWGAAYDANITAGRRAAAGLGFDEAKLSSLESKLGTGEMLKLFATLGSKMGEPDFAVNGRSGDAAGFGTSPAAALQQISDLKNDQGFMTRYMSGDKDAISKMTRLNGLAYPG